MNKNTYFEEHHLVYLNLISDMVKEDPTDKTISAVNELLSILIKQLKIGISGNYLLFFNAIKETNKILNELDDNLLFESKDKIREQIGTSKGFYEVYKKSKEVVIKIFNDVDLSTVSIYADDIDNDNDSIKVKNMSMIISDNYQWYQKYNVFYSNYFSHLCLFFVNEKDPAMLKDYCCFIEYIQTKSVMFNPDYLHNEKILDIFIENINNKEGYISKLLKKAISEIKLNWEKSYFNDVSNKTFIKKAFKETESSSQFFPETEFCLLIFNLLDSKDSDFSSYCLKELFRIIEKEQLKKIMTSIDNKELMNLRIHKKTELLSVFKKYGEKEISFYVDSKKINIDDFVFNDLIFILYLSKIKFKNNQIAASTIEINSRFDEIMNYIIMNKCYDESGDFLTLTEEKKEELELLFSY